MTDLNPSTPPVRLSVDSRAMIRYVIGFCVVAEISFLFIDYFFNYSRLIDVSAIRKLSNLAREDSLASWFGTTQTMMISLTLWLIYASVRALGESKGVRRGWLVIAVFYSYMTVDDGAQLHERLATYFGDLMFSGEITERSSWIIRFLDRFPSYYWQLTFLPVFGALGVFMLYFLWRHLRPTRSRLLVVAAIGVLVSAIGLDFFEGLGENHPWNPFRIISETFDLEEFTQSRFGKTPYDTLRHFQKAIEETLEMFAHSLMWLAFLRHLTRIAADLQVRFLKPAA